jgi:transcriptional regulator with PAS, ATPase and Fis domain
MQKNISSIHQPHFMTREIWEKTLSCKKSLLETGKLPGDCHFVRKEVRDSWIRSLFFGVNPNADNPKRELDKKEYENIINSNRLLLEVAEPILDSFDKLANMSDYELHLTNPQGVILLSKGRLDSLLKQERLYCVQDEQVCGTRAHSLAARLGGPVQLVGPENYLFSSQNDICTCAPIWDEHKQILGVVSLLIRESTIPWSKETHIIQAHSMGWVNSIAMAIGLQLQLQYNNYRLEATLSSVDEGIIMIDNSGIIFTVNEEGANVLGQPLNTLQGKNLSSFLKNDSSLLSLILSGTNVQYVEDITITPKGERSYLFSSCSISDGKYDFNGGAVIRINSVKKLNSFAANQTNSSQNIYFNNILGESKSIIEAKKRALSFAKSEENILLLGETGTGKEIFAHAIHNASRPNGPFIAVNCAALPHSLVESELFGYESGSFTGAERKGRLGKIELANNGTLFLDEVGDMPLDLQSVLLRVLEDKQVMRIGGNIYRKVDFRLIAATNCNLSQLVKEKQFRADLYYRLFTFKIDIPSLAAREGDIMLLATHFLKVYCEKMGYEGMEISPAVANILKKYPWPGNVRQLEKTIIFAATLSTSGIIEVENLPEEIRTYEYQVTLGPDDKQIEQAKVALTVGSMKEMEKTAISQALIQVGNDKTKAAAILGIGLSTLYKKMKYYNISIN